MCIRDSRNTDRVGFVTFTQSRHCTVWLINSCRKGVAAPWTVSLTDSLNGEIFRKNVSTEIYWIGFRGLKISANLFQKLQFWITTVGVNRWRHNQRYKGDTLWSVQEPVRETMQPPLRLQLTAGVAVFNANLYIPGGVEVSWKEANTTDGILVF